MPTFDLVEVRRFTADLRTQMDRCDNGEGMQCATLDAALKYYADLCCKFCDEVRRWGREIFAGRVAFDRDVERLWQEEGHQLYLRAIEVWGHGRKAEGPCYVLDGQAILQSALWDLYRLLTGWVTPKLAVGPSARQGLALDSTAAAEARRRIESLPPLPADWQPEDAHQQAYYRMLRTS
ncbi:MAG TPA: hypothetical protein VKI17_13090 [Gemmataceae bacterium]|nr:hypothetical protein [Gemmataceae bacterium]